ncbi:cobalt transporter ATP-binding subunit [Mycoplasmopsis californica]|uniref:Energy-coupling factor transporter ATPase n=1 Tax=Mycoplasmopsis equigenitalium TaxID=114883 RepID=A0ABY5J4F0_9BACT|nr:energy-coupling factor transporter ATPase [Mycoplasmopsis equigenitalium]UUD37012.1 energy-coupling factor transporter ATPase [Mycoplasmopsis equigenitalium]VEU69689.1 cobalt transporter ATP-binding subunit [Mycoplasmopsis californica]
MITVKNLKFKYSQNSEYALNDVSFHIPEGKYVAIMGHNGSGKSTLSRCLVGLFKPESGTITLDGITISKETLSEIRQKIGIVFQNPDNQFIGASVEDDIAFGLENKQISREEMRETILRLVKKVDMESYLQYEPQNLSGGQKQRVAIASVLALDPKIVIFDEVTSMLDPKGKKEVLALIKDIQTKENKTLISITHDMEEAIKADYCLVFSHGKLIASGHPVDILKNKAVVEEAKIDSPFIYRLSSQIEGIDPTYKEEELIEALCK